MSDEFERQLASRTWPPVGSRREMWKAIRATEPHVRKGRVFNRELRLYMGVSEAFPPGESAITALVAADNRQIYGVTRVDPHQRPGGTMHFFYYSTEPLGDAVVNLWLPDGVLAAGNALVALGNRIYGGVSEYHRQHHGGCLFVHETQHDGCRPFHTMGGPTEQLAVPVPGEGIATLAAAASGSQLVGVSTVNGTIFAYHIASQIVRHLERPDGMVSPSPVLASGPDGMVYGSDAAGRLFRVDASAGRVTLMDVRLPRGTALSAACVDPVSGGIYFGTTPDGALIALDARTGTLRDLGSAPPAAPIRTMTVGHDGHVYGVAGPRGQLAKMFEADPVTGNVELLGCLMAGSERYWHGYEFDASCTGDTGEIYFGESDRISHLFMYFPPQARHS